MVANILENHLINEFTPRIFLSPCESTHTHLQETQSSVYCRVTDAGRICSRSRTSVSVSTLCPELMSCGCSTEGLHQCGSCLVRCDTVSVSGWCLTFRRILVLSPSGSSNFGQLDPHVEGTVMFDTLRTACSVT